MRSHTDRGWSSEGGQAERAGPYGRSANLRVGMGLRGLFVQDPGETGGRDRPGRTPPPQRRRRSPPCGRHHAASGRGGASGSVEDAVGLLGPCHLRRRVDQLPGTSRCVGPRSTSSATFCMASTTGSGSRGSSVCWPAIESSSSQPWLCGRTGMTSRNSRRAVDTTMALSSWVGSPSKSSQVEVGAVALDSAGQHLVMVEVAAVEEVLDVAEERFEPPADGGRLAEASLVDEGRSTGSPIIGSVGWRRWEVIGWRGVPGDWIPHPHRPVVAGGSRPSATASAWPVNVARESAPSATYCAPWWFEVQRFDGARGELLDECWIFGSPSLYCDHPGRRFPW